MRSYRAYNVICGLFQATYFSFSQTMMAELSPPGFDNMVSVFHIPPTLSRRLEVALLVLRLVRPFEQGFQHDRPEHHPGHNRSFWKQLERFPLPLRSLSYSQFDHMVLCGCHQGKEGRCRVGRQSEEERLRGRYIRDRCKELNLVSPYAIQHLCGYFMLVFCAFEHVHAKRDLGIVL